MHEIFVKGIDLVLSENLSQHEVDCKCTSNLCHFTILNEKTVWSFEALRKDVDEPLRITSGYRCQKHNFAVGGREDSYHTTGDALDIVCPDSMCIEKFGDKARKFFDFVLVYPDKKVIHCHNVRS